MYKKIENYGIIGNLHSVALVGLDGSIDWMCLPYMDDSSVFAGLLDEEKGGRFCICPEGEWDSVADYMKTTNILTTAFRTRTGVMVLTDFMPVVEKGRCEESEHPELYRMVQVTEGELTVKVEYLPRFDYARAETTLEESDYGILARGGGKKLALCCSREGLKVEDNRGLARWKLSKGDFAWFYLRYNEEVCQRIDPSDAGRALRETEAFWRGWATTTETGFALDHGCFRPMVERSALVLKLLQYRPTGAIAAAATTSLPEEVGGVRNWDYRFSWVRDTALTLDALFNLGHLSETEQYLQWIEKLIRERGAGLQVLYDLQGEEIVGETVLDHLEGYKGSSPVRMGNAAVNQTQLDIYGEIMDAALKLAKYIGKIDVESWPFLREICETVLKKWKEKDAGIWEVRCDPRHFVYSKVMCWVALDRGISIARRFGFPANLGKWEKSRDEIRDEIHARGYNEEKKAFVQHYDSDALDASALLLSIFGFLPYDDPRMVSTVDAIQRELTHEGFIYRYRPHQTGDGLPGGEGVFLTCTFWLIDNLIGQGKLEEGERLLHRMEHVCNHLGLFSEEYDIRWKSALGNFPQALTHIGYINSSVALCRARTQKQFPENDRDLRKKVREKLLITSDFILNEGETGKEKKSSEEIDARMKKQMNLLQGTFFQSARGRVAYERMENSEAYKDYVALTRHLQHFDLDTLQSRNEKMAFWINLYNVIVIHGVVALGINESVREVPRFFRRIKYQVGGMEFSADDIEHGILRRNQRLPGSLFRPFGEKDLRQQFMVKDFDPRIHFALVCASRSCPPIEIYTAQNLDEQLDISAQTFLNTEGVRIDRRQGEVRLSEIFRWYDEDFGGSDAERLRFIIPFLYDEKDRRYLQEHSESLLIKYRDYDWRLNRV